MRIFYLILIISLSASKVFCQDYISIPIGSGSDCFTIDTFNYPINIKDSSYFTILSKGTIKVNEKIISNKLKYIELFDKTNEAYNIILLPNYVTTDTSLKSIEEFSSTIDTVENEIRYNLGPFSKLDVMVKTSKYSEVGGNILSDGEKIQWCKCKTESNKINCEFLLYLVYCINDNPPYDIVRYSCTNVKQINSR